MNVLEFWVDGVPVPKGRARTVRTRGGKVVSYTPKRTRQWEQTIKLFAQAACSAVRWKPTDAAYEVHVVVHRARRSGDADNHLKAFSDAANGVIWPDDRMVRKASVELVDGEQPGMMVRVTREAA